MKIYFAGVSNVEDAILDGRVQLKDLNILESYYYVRNKKNISHIIKGCKSFLLDSGAFTLRETLSEVNWEKYIDEYADFIVKHDVKLFFELDIDNVIGLKNVEILRERLETKTGKKSIPVWHPNRGKEYFVEMCKNYDYVSLGGIVNAKVSRKNYVKTFPWFIETAHKFGCKIHGLGFTKTSELPKYHFDSVDSTTWHNGMRFGELHVFQNSTIKRVTSIQKGTKTRRLRNPNEVNIVNLNEWVKFNKYTETHL